MFAKDLIIESTSNELYQSAVDAFPNTTKRQYATHPVRVSELTWTPFLGVKTLFVRGHVQNESRTYSPMILFKGVQYTEGLSRGIVELHIDQNERVFLERLSYENTDVLLRCNCKDFHWRFTHWNKVDQSLYGRDRKKYEAKYHPGSANPTKSPGMCKHLMKMMQVLGESGIIS